MNEEMLAKLVDGVMRFQRDHLGRVSSTSSRRCTYLIGGFGDDVVNYFHPVINVINGRPKWKEYYDTHLSNDCFCLSFIYY